MSLNTTDLLPAGGAQIKTRYWQNRFVSCLLDALRIGVFISIAMSMAGCSVLNILWLMPCAVLLWCAALDVSYRLLRKEQQTETSGIRGPGNNGINFLAGVTGCVCLAPVLMLSPADDRLMLLGGMAIAGTVLLLAWRSRLPFYGKRIPAVWPIAGTVLTICGALLAGFMFR